MKTHHNENATHFVFPANRSNLLFPQQKLVVIMHALANSRRAVTERMLKTSVRNNSEIHYRLSEPVAARLSASSVVILFCLPCSDQAMIPSRIIKDWARGYHGRRFSALAEHKRASKPQCKVWFDVRLTHRSVQEMQKKFMPGLLFCEFHPHKRPVVGLRFTLLAQASLQKRRAFSLVIRKYFAFPQLSAGVKNLIFARKNEPRRNSISPKQLCQHSCHCTPSTHSFRRFSSHPRQICA